MSKKSFVIICIFAALVIVGGIWFQNRPKPSSQNQGKVLADKERKLTAEAQKIYTDNIKKAEENLRSLKPNDPKLFLAQINDYLYLGQQYFGLGQLEKSKKSYLKVLEIEPNYESATVGLAVTYSDAGELNEAGSLLQAAIKNNPKNYNLWLQFIDIRKTMGSSSEEINKIFQDALAGTNNYPDVVTRYAEFLESLGKISEAIAQWQQAIKINPQGATVYNQEISRLKKLPQ